MEEQSTHCICITHKGKQNGIALLTNERCTEQLEWTQILPLWQYVHVQANSKKSSNKAIEEQSACFIYVYYSLRETEWQFTFNKHRAFGAQILLIQNAWAAQQTNIAKIVLVDDLWTETGRMLIVKEEIFLQHMQLNDSVK